MFVLGIQTKKAASIVTLGSFKSMPVLSKTDFVELCNDSYNRISLSVSLFIRMLYALSMSMNFFPSSPLG
ncbi:hypothetical protein ES705_49966 [subsurface metagenome]